MRPPRPLDRPGPGDRAPDVTVLDSRTSAVRLSSSWAARPAVLVFLRYFGCPFCQAQVVRLRDDRELFDATGAAVVLIGQGTPEEAEAFRDRRSLPFTCLVDPDRSAYRAYGLGRARVGQVFGPRVAAPFVRLNLGAETRQRGLHRGSFWQMPGTFVVDASGIVRFAHRNRDVADSPPNREVLDALAALSPQRGLGRQD